MYPPFYPHPAMRPQYSTFEPYYDQPKQEYHHRIGGGLAPSAEPKVGAGAFSEFKRPSSESQEATPASIRKNKLLEESIKNILNIKDTPQDEPKGEVKPPKKPDSSPDDEEDEDDKESEDNFDMAKFNLYGPQTFPSPAPMAPGISPGFPQVGFPPRYAPMPSPGMPFGAMGGFPSTPGMYFPQPPPFFMAPPAFGMPDPYYYPPGPDEVVIGGETLRQGDEEPTLPYYNPQQQYPYTYPHLKMPLKPRREGEAPNFVFYKQHKRIQILRDKRKDQETSSKYFTRLRIVSHLIFLSLV